MPLTFGILRLLWNGAPRGHVQELEFTFGIFWLLWNGAPRRRGSAPQPRVRRACSSVPSAGQRALRSLRTSLRPIRPPGGSQTSIDLREARSTASRTFRVLHRLNVILSE